MLHVFWSAVFLCLNGSSAFLSTKSLYSSRSSLFSDPRISCDQNFMNNVTIDQSDDESRRIAMFGLGATTVVAPLTSARAGLPELDQSGQLFSPRSAMLSGGSEAARGIPLKGSRTYLKPGEALQTVYETRFITYLARFLLNFDPAANSWWMKKGFTGAWEEEPTANPALVENSFAEFAESVEVGLADYFVGPYGAHLLTLARCWHTSSVQTHRDIIAHTSHAILRQDLIRQYLRRERGYQRQTRPLL